MDPECPPPPAVALEALAFVRNPPRPGARLADLLAFCKLCCSELKASRPQCPGAAIAFAAAAAAATA